MSGEVEWRPILHVRPKFDVFTLVMTLHNVQCRPKLKPQEQE